MLGEEVAVGEVAAAAVAAAVAVAAMAAGIGGAGTILVRVGPGEVEVHPEEIADHPRVTGMAMMGPAVPVAVGQLELVEAAGHPRGLVVLHEEALAEPNPRPSRLHRGVLPRLVLPTVPLLCASAARRRSSEQ